jgi:hypothetical protein
MINNMTKNGKLDASYATDRCQLYQFTRRDYLDMCNSIKEVHEVLKVEDQTDEEYEYQPNEERLHELEKDLHHYVMHIEKMKKQLNSIKIRKRLSPRLKTVAIKQFSDIMGLHSLREYTEEAIMEQTNTTPKTIYEWYLKEHNRLQRYQQLSITSVIEECKDERNEIIACISNELGVV